MLLHADGFATYGTTVSNMTRGVYASATSRISLQTTPLRNEGLQSHCVRAQGTGGADNGGLRLLLNSSITDVITGCAMRIEAAPPSDTENGVFSFTDSANGDQCSLVVGTNLDLIFKRGSMSGGTEVARSAANVIRAGVYEFIEIHVRAGNTGSPGGAVEVRVNGQTVIDETGVDTTATANINIQSVYLAPHGGTNAETCYYQDWYVCDISGSVNNDFLGDTVWTTLFPNGDGVVQDWTPSATGAGYLMIDEATPDDDSSYIVSAAANDESEFDLPNASTETATISACIHRYLARKDDTGAGSTQGSIVSSESSPETTDTGADNALTQTYAVYSDVSETDPATGAAWTPAAVNAARLKFERTA